MDGAAVGVQGLAMMIFVALAGCGGGGGGGGGGNNDDLPIGVGEACQTDGGCDAGLVCQSCVEECTGTVRRCAGFAGSSELISLDDGVYPGGCEDMAGSWLITETLDGGCDLDGDFLSLDASGTGEVDIRQNGCSVSYKVTSEFGNFSRSGAIVGSRARLTGPFLISRTGLKLSTNEAFVEGVVSDDDLALRGFGVAEGTLEGAPITCDATSTADGFRP
jgi:hypothetical protein